MENIMEITISEDQTVQAHRHDCLEFFYMINGTLECTVGQKAFPVIRDDFFIIPKSTEHSCTSSEKIIYMTIHLNHKAARNYIDPERIRCDAAASRTDNHTNSKTRRLLRQIMNLYISENPMEELLVMSACYELLYHLASFYTVHTSAEISEDRDTQAADSKICRRKLFFADEAGRPCQSHAFLHSVYV